MMTDASTALWHADLHLAESIISDRSEVTTAQCTDIDQRCARLLALQTPVATDLRIVVAAMDAVSDLVRMGKLARHIVKIARLKHPFVRLPEDLERIFARMALLATTLAHDAAQAIENRHPHCAEQLVSVEEEIGALHRKIFCDFNIRLCRRISWQFLASSIVICKIAPCSCRLADLSFVGQVAIPRSTEA
jgi:phosphate transport system protein